MKLKDVFKKKEHIEFLTGFGYDLEKNIDQAHPLTKTSVLHDLIIHKQEEMTSILVSSGHIHVNQVDNHSDYFRKGRSPLILAILKKHIGIVRVLIRHGANIAQGDAEGIFPLIFTVVSDDMDIAEELIAAKADVNQETPSCKTSYPNCTALMYAASLGHWQNANFLIERGARITNSEKKEVFDRCFDNDTQKKIKSSIKLMAYQTKTLRNTLRENNLTGDIINIISDYTPGVAFIEKNGLFKHPPKSSAITWADVVGMTQKDKDKIQSSTHKEQKSLVPSRARSLAINSCNKVNYQSPQASVSGTGIYKNFFVKANTSDLPGRNKRLSYPCRIKRCSLI